MFAASSASVLGAAANHASRISPSCASRGRAQAEREHVRVVPLAARRRRSRRRRTAPRGRPRPCSPRSTRPSRSSSTRRPARRGPRRRRGPRPRRTRPSRRARRRPARRAAAARARARRSSSTTASATPVRSSAATAIRMLEYPASGAIVAAWSTRPPEADVLAIGRDLAAALPGRRAPSAEGARRPGDGPRLAGRGAARRAVPLRRRRPRVPRPRRPRPPPHRLPRRGRRPPAAAAGRDADGRDAAPAAARSAPPPRPGVKHMAHRFIVGETPTDATGVLEGLWKDGVGTSVDLLGEATVTAAEADRYAGALPRGARRPAPRSTAACPRGRGSRPTRSARSRARTCR